MNTNELIAGMIFKPVSNFGHKIFSVLITSHSLSIQAHSEHANKT